MMPQMAILSTAYSGEVPSVPPLRNFCPLPLTGPGGRGGRLAGLALKMAEHLVKEQPHGSDAAVILGTALGSMTETMSFLESMIGEKEANPMPRAFAASVHNSIASRVALALGARGACQTFVQGPVSWAHALFAASRVFVSGGQGPVITGAVDEWSEYIGAGHPRGGESLDFPSREGGGLLLVGDAKLVNRPCVVVRDIQLSRSLDPVPWIRACLASTPVDFLLVGDSRPAQSPFMNLHPELGTPTRTAMRYEPLFGRHAAAGAIALVYASELISGSCGVGETGLAAAPHSVGVATISHLGDVALVTLEHVT